MNNLGKERAGGVGVCLFVCRGVLCKQSEGKAVFVFWTPLSWF